MAETMQQLLAQHADADGLAVLYNDAAGEQIYWTWREYLCGAARHVAAVLARADTARPMHAGALRVRSDRQRAYTTVTGAQR